MKSAKFYVYALIWANAWTLLASAQAQTPNGFDNSSFSRALKDYVDDNGMVNYKALKAIPIEGYHIHL